jgi:hypothetical protein
MHKAMQTAYAHVVNKAFPRAGLARRASLPKSPWQSPVVAFARGDSWTLEAASTDSTGRF